MDMMLRKVDSVPDTWCPWQFAVQCHSPAQRRTSQHPSDLADGARLPLDCKTIAECLIATRNDVYHLPPGMDSILGVEGGVMFIEGKLFEGWRLDGGSYDYLMRGECYIVTAGDRKFIPVCEIGNPENGIVTLRVLLPDEKEHAG